MARSAQELIDEGSYLEPAFNANSLTIPQLRGIFLHHLITYKPQANKSELVKVFNEEVKTRSLEFKKARRLAERQEPSNEDVRDGVTGRRMASLEGPKRGNRQAPADPISSVSSSRRTRKVSEDRSDSEPRPSKSGLPKRASSSTPATQSSSRRSSVKISPFSNESAPEGEEETDSAWETNNPFQTSGYSSPERKPSPKIKAKLPATRRRAAAPPAQSSSPSLPSPLNQKYIPPAPAVSRTRAYRQPALQIPPPSSPSPEPEYEREASVDVYEYDDDVMPLNDTYEYQESRRKRSSSPGAYPLDDDDYSDGSEEEHKQDIDSVLPQKFAELRGPPKAKAVIARPPPSPPSPLWSWVPSLRAMVYVALGGLLFSLVSSHRRDSRYIGYCDAGRDTNLRIEEIQRRRQAINDEARRCIVNFNTSAPLDCNPVPPQRPFEALSCTPCPKRAVCTPNSVTCHEPLIIKRQLLGSLSNLASGLPLFGSVAFPPKCVEDSEKLKKVKGTGQRIDLWLAKTRGDRVCVGTLVKEDDGGEAKAYGLELEAMKETARQRAKAPPNWEDLFFTALSDLEAVGAVIKGVDANGYVYYASGRSDYTLRCRLKISARDTWLAWRKIVFTFVGLMASMAYLRYRRIQSRVHAQEVKRLIQEAYDTLQDRESAHHVDPVTCPEPYIVPVHLRDLILQQEDDPRERQRLWRDVEKVVEANSNVRTNVEEVRGEDTKVWRWVGSSTPNSRRVSFANRTQSGTLLKD